MADAVTSRTVIDGPTNAVFVFTNVSDGTGESAVKKIDVSTLLGAPASVSITRIHYAVVGMVVSLLEDATSDVKIVDLNGNGTFDFESFGGIPCSQASGFTGDILLTTTGHTSGDSYTLVIEVRK